MSKDKAASHVAPPTEKEPDRSPDGLRTLAKRIAERRESGICVPGSAVGLYADAMRALAREREQDPK